MFGSSRERGPGSARAKSPGRAARSPATRQPASGRDHARAPRARARARAPARAPRATIDSSAAHSAPASEAAGCAAPAMTGTQPPSTPEIASITNSARRGTRHQAGSSSARNALEPGHRADQAEDHARDAHHLRVARPGARPSSRPAPRRPSRPACAPRRAAARRACRTRAAPSRFRIRWTGNGSSTACSRLAVTRRQASPSATSARAHVADVVDVCGRPGAGARRRRRTASVRPQVASGGRQAARALLDLGHARELRARAGPRRDALDQRVRASASGASALDEGLARQHGRPSCACRATARAARASGGSDSA